MVEHDNLTKMEILSDALAIFWKCSSVPASGCNFRLESVNSEIAALGMIVNVGLSLTQPHTNSCIKKVFIFN